MSESSNSGTRSMGLRVYVSILDIRDPRKKGRRVGRQERTKLKVHLDNDEFANVVDKVLESAGAKIAASITGGKAVKTL